MSKHDGKLRQATALARAGRWRDAASVFAEAIALGASDYATHFNFGTALMQCGAWASGSEQMRAALQYAPDSLDALNNLAAASIKMGHARSAEEASRRIVAIDSSHHIAWTTLGMALNEQGGIQEGVACLRKALALAPSYQIARDNLLMALNFLATDGAAHAADHQSFCAVLGRMEPKPMPAITGRRIRVGYVSPDFRTHSVASFMKGIVASHDRTAFEVICYSSTHNPDHLTRQFAESANRFLDIASMSDSEAASRIEADGIDILVDLAGHTSGNRLGVFERRPAPVQVTYLGYPATTGCSFIDYRLIDEITDPPGSEAYSTETLVRLPAPFLTYGSIYAFPEVLPPPVLENGFITFGSFNHSSKISGCSIGLWARLLNSVPGSRLVLKARGFSDETVCREFRERFAQSGLDASRLSFAGLLSDPTEHLASYGRIDIALDTFPYNGTTTTCESLWMGVPVVNLTGNLHAARVGKSILTTIGLAELACDSEAAFVWQGKALAENQDRLATLRGTLRQTVAKSPLCDPKGFTANLESAYRSMLSLR